MPGEVLHRDVRRRGSLIIGMFPRNCMTLFFLITRFDHGIVINYHIKTQNFDMKRFLTNIVIVLKVVGTYIL